MKPSGELGLSHMRILCWQDPGRQCYSGCPAYDRDWKVCLRKRGDVAELARALEIALQEAKP
jgi:hypothetical protein